MWLTGAAVWGTVGVLAAIDGYEIVKYGKCAECKRIMQTGRSKFDRTKCPSCVCKQTHGTMIYTTPKAWEPY